MASRLPRDIAGTEDSQASPTGKLEDELHKLQAGIEKVFKESLFNKENVEVCLNIFFNRNMSRNYNYYYYIIKTATLCHLKMYIESCKRFEDRS